MNDSNQEGLRRFAIVVLMLGLFIWTAYESSSLGSVVGLNSIQLLGKTVDLGAMINALAFALESIAFVFVTEIMLFGFRSSSAYRLTTGRTTSGHLDIWAFLFIQLKIKGVLTILFTFGAYYLGNKLVNDHFSSFNLYDRIAGFSSFAAVTFFILLFTYFDYWNHRLSHTKLLWPLHRFHHSATELNVITSYRNHPGSDLISPFTKVLPLAICGVPPTVMFHFLSANAFYNLIVHVNEDFSWGYFGKYILFSPRHHRIHHSCLKHHFDKNYGEIPIWDRIHGTYYDDSPTETIVLGVPSPDYSSDKNLVRVLVRDFRDFLAGTREILPFWGKKNAASAEQ